MQIEWLKNLFLHAGVDEVSFQRAQPSITNSNRSSLIVYSAVAMLFLLLMFFASFAMPSIAGFQHVYLSFSLVSLAALLYVTLLYDRVPQLLLPCMYVFMALLFALGIILGTAADPNSLSVTFIAFLLTIPLLFTDRPLRVVLLVLFAMLSFNITILLTKTGDAQAIDLLDGTIFGLLSCVVSTHMITVKVGRIVYADRSDMLSRTDLLTGCKNRNCYEQQLNEHGSACRDALACVYVDVNGLHEMNNAHGHTAGDAMLRYVAEQMRLAFSAGEIYRIGGDEFVSLICDIDADLLDVQVRQVVTAVEAKGYHIAIGSALVSRNELDILHLIRTAEERMYQDKGAYYHTNNLPPRNRR